MNNFLKSNWVVVLIVVFILISLFPPFNWYLSSSLNERQKGRYKRVIVEQLPIRSYDFIFRSSLKTVILETWGWDNRSESSVKGNSKVPLQRAIILYELMLNYVLSFLIIVLFYLLNERRKLKKQ